MGTRRLKACSGTRAASVAVGKAGAPPSGRKLGSGRVVVIVVESARPGSRQEARAAGSRVPTMPAAIAFARALFAGGARCTQVTTSSR